MASKETQGNTPKVKFRTNYDADFKTLVVKYAIQTSNKAASDHFGINESNVRRWKRLSLKAEILENTIARRALAKKTRVRRKTSGRSRKRRNKTTPKMSVPEHQEIPSDVERNMPDRCSIPECRAISNRINGKLSMFRLPKDAALRAKWLRSMGKKDWTPAEKAVICERHFEPSCITKKFGQEGSEEIDGRRLKTRIALGALPTILVPPGTPPIPVQETVKRRRRGKNKKLLEGRRRKGRKKKNAEDADSMPLQQRLTAISSAGGAPEPEKPVQTLKSQPLSPTKLKVTRQSAAKQPQQQKPLVEEQETVKEEICLKWNTHHSNMQTAFPALLNKEQYCDVTLVAEGKSLKCHKLILSSCSSYFDEVLENVVPYQHPIIFMKDIPFNILKALCDFMYVGEVNIVQSDLDQILAVGDSLKIKGLASRSEVKNAPADNSSTVEPKKVPVKQSKAATKPTEEKNNPVDDAEITDPLDLMEPTYEEAATPDVPAQALRRNDQTRKSTGRRARKRKHVEVDHEPSPPVFRMRKGTRSRPNVKVPRYFNANFDNSAPAPAPEAEEFSESVEPEESYIDSYMNILEHIKTEPLDIEDGLISFEEESFVEADMGQYDPAPQIQETPQKVVKKRKLSKRGFKAKVEKPDPLVDQNLEKDRPIGETVTNPCERIESQEDTGELLGYNDNGDSVEKEGKDQNDTRVEISETEGIHVENSDGMELENGDKDETTVENSDKEERGMESIESDSVVAHIENSEFENDKIVENQLENSETQIFDEVNQAETNHKNDSHETGVDGTIGEGNEISGMEDGDAGKGETLGENYEIRIENSYTDVTQAGVCEYEEMKGDEADSEGREDSIRVEEGQSTSIPEITEFGACKDVVDSSTEEKSIDDKMQHEKNSQEEILTNSIIEEERNKS